MDITTYSYYRDILPFLESVGIGVAESPLTATTFLPGLELGQNVIYVDPDKLKYPGDILHEAGHIAVAQPHLRRLMGTDKMPEGWPEMGEEIAAILWSYAALTHLNIPPEFVFHQDGYKNCSQWYREQFTGKNYIGLPLLQWMGIAYTNQEVNNGHPPFPSIKNWMRP